MGVFGEYSGEINIAESDKEQFIAHMSKLLNYGGMIQFEHVSMFGYEVALMKPVEVALGEKISFHYNYFEEDAWESAGFDTNDCKLWSGKIGSCEFDEVIMAGYMLYEAYTKQPGMAMLNGEIIKSTYYMGWINQVLGTSFSMKNRFKLWEQAEAYIFSELEYGYRYCDSDYADILYDMIPNHLLYAACSTELADLMYIGRGTSELEECRDTLKEGTYPADVYHCREVIRKYYETDGDSKLEELIEFLKKSRDERVAETNTIFVDIAQASLYMPARVFIILAVEVENTGSEDKDTVSFWGTWKQCKDDVYHDEIKKEYISEELMQQRIAQQNAPIPTVRTSDFLRQDGFFAFYGTPDELKNQPNYYLSDDDRLYWYDGSDEVKVSKRVDEWLKKLATRHAEIMKNEDLESITENFIKYLLTTFVEVESYYKRIFPFYNMFYEFIENGKQREYVAAIKLFKELADSETYRKDGEIIKYIRSSWDMTSKNVTHNRARMKLKRYLSVMANKMLRQKYFGF
ncbi:MAG: hypothetical protein ACI4F4_07345 [Lachnospiraceae bacterium]